MSILKNIVTRLITAKMSPGSKASIVISADNGAAAIVLPLVPAELPEVSNPQNNETFEGILGTMSVIGTLGLRTVSIKGLLPVDPTKYPFANDFSYSIDNAKDYHYKIDLIEYRMVQPVTGGLVS